MWCGVGVTGANVSLLWQLTVQAKTVHDTHGQNRERQKYNTLNCEAQCNAQCCGLDHYHASLHLIGVLLSRLLLQSGNLLHQLCLLLLQLLLLSLALEELPPTLRQGSTTFVNLRDSLDDVEALIRANGRAAAELGGSAGDRMGSSSGERTTGSASDGGSAVVPVAARCAMLP